jgi:hypothetical protein
MYNIINTFKGGIYMSQTNPGGTHYQDLLREYERNLRNAESKRDSREIEHWKNVIAGLRQEAKNRGIHI